MKPPCSTELLILSDGRVLVHNLTPEMADLLHQINPADEVIEPRAGVNAMSARRDGNGDEGAEDRPIPEELKT